MFAVRADAEDVVQDALVKALAAIGRLALSCAAIVALLWLTLLGSLAALARLLG
jgi:DNA-directed RNA polymerase specialized sigma24 family protein